MVNNKSFRHFLRIKDLSKEELLDILAYSKRLKKSKDNKNKKEVLKNKTLAMIFEKPSLRTRVSLESGMTQLGGHAIYLGPQDIQMGIRESIHDIAKTLSRLSDIISARVFKHESVVELAKYSSIPVINALSNLEHPCQALADLLTIMEKKKSVKDLKVVFIGDGENNVPHSLAIGVTTLGGSFVCASPKSYKMKEEYSQEAKKIADAHRQQFLETDNAELAIKNADVVYTDTWISMGDEQEKAKRVLDFNKYRITDSLFRLAKKDAIFMHDLPAYRGNEVDSKVIDGPNSVVFDQAENRLHTEKAIILKLLKK